jgi:outer membrane biogenesis lipoprotein LolB
LTWTRTGRGVVALLATSLFAACATRGHIATPDEVARLRQAEGLSASGRLTLQGPKGKFSARIVFGVARPESLRIEIPGGAGLRFLLVTRNGRLRADLPGDDAMFEGASSREVMNGLFGIDLAPKDLVDAILGSPNGALEVAWRFDRSLPSEVTIAGANRTRLTLNVDEPQIEAPPSGAFDFGPPRPRVWGLSEMSERLGLTR